MSPSTPFTTWKGNIVLQYIAETIAIDVLYLTALRDISPPSSINGIARKTSLTEKDIKTRKKGVPETESISYVIR